MATSAENVARIRQEAEQVCAPYGIDVYKVGILAEVPGERVVVSPRLPEGMSADSPEVEVVKPRLQAIPGVEMVVIEQPAGPRRM